MALALVNSFISHIITEVTIIDIMALLGVLPSKGFTFNAYRKPGWGFPPLLTFAGTSYC
jgi:hypothetical protein